MRSEAILAGVVLAARSFVLKKNTRFVLQLSLLVVGIRQTNVLLKKKATWMDLFNLLYFNKNVDTKTLVINL